MSELMERSLDLINGQESDTVLIRRSEVADIDDDRTYLIAFGIEILVTEVAHPCSATLGVTRKIVADEQSHKVAGLIRYLPGFGSVVEKLQAFDLLEVDSIEGMSSLEDALLDVMDLEIRFGDVLVKVILGLADSFGIEPPVPWLDLRA